MSGYIKFSGESLTEFSSALRSRDRCLGIKLGLQEKQGTALSVLFACRLSRLSIV